jgi:hypothetical protein
MATDPIPNGLTSLPNADDLPVTRGGGYDQQRVREAFDAFRRHVLQLQAQLRVVQAAGRSSEAPEAPGHAVRMAEPEPEPEPEAHDEPGPDEPEGLA